MGLARSVSAGFTSNYIISSHLAQNDVWDWRLILLLETYGLRRNNVWVNSSNPATNSLPIVSFVPATVGALFAAMSL